jgi:hypothetical protein
MGGANLRKVAEHIVGGRSLDLGAAYFCGAHPHQKRVGDVELLLQSMYAQVAQVEETDVVASGNQIKHFLHPAWLHLAGVNVIEHQPKRVPVDAIQPYDFLFALSPGPCQQGSAHAPSESVFVRVRSFCIVHACMRRCWSKFVLRARAGKAAPSRSKLS